MILEHLVVVCLFALCVVVFRRARYVESTQQSTQRTNARLTRHLDHLIRHFHISPHDAPYVAETSVPGSTAYCWHCHAPFRESHTETCPYGYVTKYFTYANNKPVLRD